jgi:hypothetical protein
MKRSLLLPLELAVQGIAILLLAAAPAPAQGWREWKVESAGPSGAVLLWENASLGREGQAAPRTAALGLPAGSDPRASLEILDERPAGAAAVSGPGGAPLALSKPSRYRDLEVSSLTLRPDLGTGVLARARIRVDFRATMPAGARPVFAPDADSPPERHLASWILNYSQSRGFRSHPAPALAKAAADGGAASDGPSPSAGLPRIRLLIKTSGEDIEILDYQALKDAGVPVDRIDPRFMRLWHDGVEMPMHLSGGDDGRWHPGDHLEFIGKAPEGDRTRLSLFSATTTFMLTWEGGRLGLRAPTVPVSPRKPGPDSPAPAGLKDAPPFRVREHMEVDAEILRIGGTSAEAVQDLGAAVETGETADFWMWMRQGPEKDALSVPFQLDYDPVPQGEGAAARVLPLRIRINLQGLTDNPNANPDHHVKFILNDNDISQVDGVANDAIWDGQASHTWVSLPLNPKVLKAGRNVLVIQKVNDLKANDGTPVEVQDAYLNWFELEFPSGYSAQGDVVRFANDFEDSLGVRLFTLRGFSTGDLSIWDAGGRKLTGFQATRMADGFEVAFSDSLAGPTRYIAAALEKRHVPKVRLDTLPDLLAPSEGADYLVVTHRELLGTALDSLLAHRRKQGLRTRTVLAGHVYQAFGNGDMDPAAIRRFVAHAYRNWPRPAPAYLLLLGEASIWYEKKEDPDRRTLVPTHLVDIKGWGVAAADDWFAKVSGEDELADLFVGRIPVADHRDLSKVVRKILALENHRPRGHWNNKALLVSGYEETFTAQNGRLQRLAVAHDRHYSREDLYPQSPHYRPASRRLDFMGQLDSAFNLVSFVGHGGGAVWSDDGILTLKHLDEKRLKADYPVPLVSSITCLTGYFEDVHARSLGEELVRLDKAGAAAFYGAAGYISNLAGEALSYEVLDAAARGGATTVGAIVHRAESMVQLKTGTAFLPVLSEFNLLGDPAQRFGYPENPSGLDLSPRTLSDATSIEVRGEDLSPAEAEGMLTLYLGDSAFSSTALTLEGGGFTVRKEIKDLAGPVPDGKAVFHWWSDAESRVATAPFTTLDWLIDSVRLDPDLPSPGDSARIRLRLATSYQAAGAVRVDGGVAFFATGGETAPQFPEEAQSILRQTDPGRLETSARIRVPLPGAALPNPSLHVGFRLNVSVLDQDGQVVRTLSNVSSRTYALPLSNLARLSLAEPAFRIPLQDSLGVWAAFRNGGLGKARDFRLVLTEDAAGATPATRSLAYGKDLAMGAVDSLFFPLADSLLLGRRLRIALAPARDGELAEQGTVKDTVFQVRTRMLTGGSDTLRLDSATVLGLPQDGKPGRVFAEKTTVAALPKHLAPASGVLPVEAWRISAPSMQDRPLILSWSPSTGSSQDGTGGSAKASSAPPDRPFWHFRLFQGEQAPWLKLDTLSDSAPWTARSLDAGVYAPFLNRDLSPPLVQLSSRGQALLPDDYVPRSTPIDVVIRDAEGVDLVLRPPSFTSREQTVDSSNLATESSGSFPTQVRYNFLPKHGASRDSLVIVASDVSGNRTRKAVAYRLGDDLTIRGLGSYPNPFADTAVFVYSLTDFCERVQLRIYSRAGRVVRTLEERNVVGYREVIWDGRSDRGGEIGNGLYFLKVTARAGDQEASRIFKLFKKRRK